MSAPKTERTFKESATLVTRAYALAQKRGIRIHCNFNARLSYWDLRFRGKRKRVRDLKDAISWMVEQ